MNAPTRTTQLPVDLGNGLVLRCATPADRDALANFNYEIHDKFDTDLSGVHRVEAWTRAPDERVFRLATLRTEAASNGFRRLVRRIDQALGRNDPAGTQSGMTLLLPYAGSGH
mgnify:CR=1 FL=1